MEHLWPSYETRNGPAMEHLWPSHETVMAQLWNTLFQKEEQNFVLPMEHTSGPTMEQN